MCEDYSHTSLGANCLNWQVFLESCDITALLPLIRFPFISKPLYDAIISSTAADDIAPTFHPACPVLHFQMKMMPMPSSIGITIQIRSVKQVLGLLMKWHI